MKVPSFVSEAVMKYAQTKRLNPHLLLYRYLYGGKIEKDKDKDKEIDKVTPLKTFISKADTNIVKHIRARQKAAIEQMTRYKSVTRTFQLVDRMVVGLGIPSSFENGLLLDWVHGVPYINGDAIKGAARSYASEPNQEIDSQQFTQIFGTQKEKTDQIKAGKVIFFNAYPVSDSNLFDIDILTNHYPGYYTGQDIEPPGDWHSPNPVPFLAIRPEVSFEFTVMSEYEELAIQAMDWLENALIKRGMGAKKRVGYGHFLGTDSDSQVNKIVMPVLDEAEKLIQKIKGLQKSQIPGMAGTLLKDIENLPSPDMQKQVANVLISQMDKKARKKQKGKPWMQKLNEILA
jgi:CRISPR-associated protein Cmr6